MSYTDDEDDDSDIEIALNRAHQKHINGLSASSSKPCQRNHEDENNSIIDGESTGQTVNSDSCSSDDEVSISDKTDQKMMRLNDKLSRNNYRYLQRKPKTRLLDIICCSSSDEDENDNLKQAKHDQSESEDENYSTKGGKENDAGVSGAPYANECSTTCSKITKQRMLKNAQLGTSSNVLLDNSNFEGSNCHKLDTKKPNMKVDDIAKDAMSLLESSSDDEDHTLPKVMVKKRGHPGKKTSPRKKKSVEESIIALIQNDKIDFNTKLSICQAKMTLMTNNNITPNKDKLNQSIEVLDEQPATQVKVNTTFVNSFDGTTSNSSSNNGNYSIIKINSLDNTTVKMLTQSLLAIHNLKASQVTVGLTYNGKVLRDYQTLSCYGIDRNDGIVQATIYKSDIGGCLGGSKTVVIGKKICLTLLVAQQRGGDYNEKLKVTIGMKQPIQTLIDEYCVIKGIDDAAKANITFKLKFDGEELDCRQTPKHYEIEDDYQIDFLLQ